MPFARPVPHWLKSRAHATSMLTTFSRGAHASDPVPAVGPAWLAPMRVAQPQFVRSQSGRKLLNA